MAIDGDSDTTASERHWLLAPVVCTVLLMAGVVAGAARALRLTRSDRAHYMLLNCLPWLTTRWAVRITAMGALVAGFVGMLYAARRFLLRWSLVDQVPVVIRVMTGLTYGLMLLALLLAGLGMRYSQVPQAHRAFRQSAKSSLLAGLAAGLATEVLCDAGEPHMPPLWHQSCAMLGGSCGLVLLGMVAAQADGEAERMANQQQSAPGEALLDSEDPLHEAPRHESTGSAVHHSLGDWIGRPVWPSWSRLRDAPSHYWARDVVDDQEPMQLDQEDPRQPGDLAEPLLQSWSSPDAEAGHLTRNDLLETNARQLQEPRSEHRSSSCSDVAVRAAPAAGLKASAGSTRGQVAAVASRGGSASREPWAAAPAYPRDTCFLSSVEPALVAF